jgi:site-specific DNA-methyltransferase (adenine-specific)
MNGIELFECIKQVSTCDELLQSVNGKTKAETQSKRGNVFEKVCDIIIKFGFYSILPNDIYDHYEGNINTCKLKKVDNLELYLRCLSVFSKGKGGSSDITLQNKNNGKWVFMSSKFYLDDSKKSIDSYDVEKILAIVEHQSHKYKECDIYLVVNNKQKVLDIITSSQSTNNYIKENIHHILDLGDLEICFQNLKHSIQDITIDEVNSKFCNSKVPLELRFHQDLITDRQMKSIDEGEKELLLGAKARSGKTYCVGGLFIKYYKKYISLNGLIITPAPTETLSQFTDDLFHKFRDFNGINIVEIKKGTDFETMVLTQNNIIIVSKQLLDDYVFEKKVEAIQQLNLDFIVFDENHFHGTTQRSKNILQSYSSPKTINLYLTATYAKPLSEWNIPLECQFYWDIEDEQLCKKRNIQGLVEKHGEDVLTFLTEENKEQLLCIYDKMPDLHILTNMMDRKRFEVIKEQIKDTSYGFSMSTLFSTTPLKKEQKKITIKQGKEKGNEKLKTFIIGGGDSFNYTGEVDKFLQYISGDGTIDMMVAVRDTKCIFERIKKISQIENSRTRLNNGDFTSQLWFLPFGADMLIDKVSCCLKERMLKNRILKNYEIKIVNSKKDYKVKDLKEEIKNWELKAKEERKDGLILLAGNQLTLGITLPFVDVVFLMNDIISSDKIIQMMYRCMTESINNIDNDKINNGIKKMGFVVDMNISRVLNTCLDYNVHKKDLNIEQKITYLIENNLINIDSDLFQGKENKTKLVEKLLHIWKADPIHNLKILLKKIEESIIDLDTKDQKMMNRYFTSSVGDDKVNVKVQFDEESEALPTGKETIKQYGGDNEVEEKDDEINTDVNISLTKDVLPFIIPLICILTMSTEHKDILEMLNVIKTSPELLSVFQDQSFIWWNKPDIIKFIEAIIEKYIRKNSCIYNISMQFKMSLQSLIDKPNELLELINECLKPKEVEKKKFGEVFTPMSFINNDMLGDLEIYYKEKYNKNIFEDETLKWGDTTAGMGNFPIAIYYKLMDDLKKKIPNEKDRKKHILEKMLFMAENNKKNCFIVKQIFNMNNEFKLNLYEGNSLQLDIQKEFGITKFDIVIGNPPYNEELTSTGAKALYNKFVEYYIEKCNLLCFVIPSRWFSGGKGLDSFRKNMLERTDIVYIKHFDDASTIFGKSVSIEGGVNYFLKDTNHNGDCMYNGSMTKFNKYDVFVDGKFHNLIDKLVKFETITPLYLGRYFGVESNDKRLKIEPTKDTIKCYVSQQKGFEKYIEKSEIKKDITKWKVITAEANGGNKCFGNIFIGKPNEIHTGSYISFNVNSEDEAKSLLSYMKCRLPNFMLSLRKNSQHINESICKWIPLPPLNKEWTDDEVYKHFKLSEDDIKLINDTNIVGYKNIVKQPNIIVEEDVEIEVKSKVKKLRIVKPKKLLVIEDDA